MSFELKTPIGFDLTSKRDMDYLARFEVAPIKNCLRSMLPPGNKEPEPKLLVQGPKCFASIRAFLLNAENSFLIPGQLYEHKDPLTSILLDTKTDNTPTALLARKGYSLRYRFETCTVTGCMTNNDFNEKSAMATSKMIGGCSDRDEREYEMGSGETPRAGFENFINKYDANGDPAVSRTASFDDLSVLGAYVTARNTYGFAVKHPDHDVMFVFEACEDVFNVISSDLRDNLVQLKEFEFELKQVWGAVPYFMRTDKNAFKHFLYAFMTEIRDGIHAAVPGTVVNMKSKAEITREHLIGHLGADGNSEGGEIIRTFFETKTDMPFVPEQYIMMFGTPFEQALTASSGDIVHHAMKINFERASSNKDAPRPDAAKIGYGEPGLVINDNSTPFVRGPFRLAL